MNSQNITSTKHYTIQQYIKSKTKQVCVILSIIRVNRKELQEQILLFKISVISHYIARFVFLTKSKRLIHFRSLERQGILVISEHVYKKEQNCQSVSSHIFLWLNTNTKGNYAKRSQLLSNRVAILIH